MINRRTLLFGAFAGLFVSKETSTEQWWKGARPGRYFTASVSPEHFPKIPTIHERWDRMNKYEDALRRFLAAEGIYPKRLCPDAKSSPS